jgi:competence protein ComEC
VGQGDCIVFQHSGRTVLIDAGPKNEYLDAGERIVAPSLYRLGVRSIDLLLVSHPDSDHAGGLPSLARRIPIGKVVIPVRFKDHEEMRRWIQRARLAPDRIEWVDEAQVVVGDYTLTLDAIADPDLTDDNDGSMFVRLTGPGLRAVFTGDASAETERRMLRKGLDWSAEILKAGHHGSKTSTGGAWIQAVNPTWAVFSCGRNNVYGHPSPEVADRLARYGVRILRTDRDGSMTFVPGKEWVSVLARERLNSR